MPHPVDLPDPLAQVIALLRPSASFSKLVLASGRWAVRASGAGPFYCAMLQGGCELSATGHAPVRLCAGAVALIPAADAIAASSLTPPPGGRLDEPTPVSPGVVRLGEPGEADTRMLIGHYSFGSGDAALLVSLLPALVVVRDEARLLTLVELLGEEARARRPGRDAVLARLLEVLLIEAFRATAGPAAAPGLLRGLADDRLAEALRRMHGAPARPWTVGELAKACALSRSAFFDRFRREVGITPMDYLLGWRMAIAKNLLRSGRIRVGEVAELVGYSSQSTFSVAFSRSTGTSPTRYACSRVGEVRDHASPHELGPHGVPGTPPLPA